MRLSDPSAFLLLVEDDEGHRLLIRENLKAGGLDCRILEMADGREALDYLLRRSRYQDPAKSQRPAVILLDIRMPRADGFAVLEKVKADPELRHIPVVMLTSTDDQAEIRRCYSLGANSYVVKSIRYEEFQERVRALGAFLNVMWLAE